MEYLQDLGTWMDAHPEGLGTRVEVVVAPPFTSLELAVEHCPPARTRIRAEHAPGRPKAPSRARSAPRCCAIWVSTACCSATASDGSTSTSTTASSPRKSSPRRSFGLRPMLCVGETIVERRGERAEEVVRGQLETALSDLDVIKATSSGLAVAYEPVWAIGTGETATADIAQSMHAFITRHARLDLHCGDRRAHSRALRRERQARECAGAAGADRHRRALVGGAALEVESFSGHRVRPVSTSSRARASDMPTERPPVALVILDGWGIAPRAPATPSRSPKPRHSMRSSLRTLMRRSSRAEWTSACRGADRQQRSRPPEPRRGRVVYQDLTRIDLAITDGGPARQSGATRHSRCGGEWQRRTARGRPRIVRGRALAPGPHRGDRPRRGDAERARSPGARDHRRARRRAHGIALGHGVARAPARRYRSDRGRVPARAW